MFAGGFTLDAAEAVVSGDGIDAFDVLDGVAQLVDKSLVVAERDGDETRYRLLETIRQYALERLDDAGATDAVRRRHAEWCADFVDRASIGVRGRDEVRWLARLRREIDNLRAGVTWAAEVDDADLALRQLGELSAMSLSLRTEGYRLVPARGRRALDLRRARPSPARRWRSRCARSITFTATRSTTPSTTLARPSGSSVRARRTWWSSRGSCSCSRGSSGEPSDPRPKTSTSS